MWSLAAIIPIACCLLVPAVIAVAAFVGFGKKKPDNNAHDDELPQEIPRYSTHREQR